MLHLRCTGKIVFKCQILLMNYKNKNQPYLKTTLLGNLKKLNSFKSSSAFWWLKKSSKRLYFTKYLFEF